jgi:excisionase family DNA binding protein
MPITEQDLDQLLSVDEAAHVLNRSPKTVYRMIADRSIDVVYVGAGRGRPHVTRRAILDYLNRRTVRASRRRPA